MPLKSGRETSPFFGLVRPKSAAPARNLSDVLRKTRGGAMGRMKEHPRYQVISLRVSDEEMEFLRQITRKGNMTISEAVRDVLNQAMAVENDPHDCCRGFC